MTKKTLIFWILEFLSTTTIAVILALGIKYAWLILIPIFILLLLKYLQWRIHISDQYQAVRNQMDLLLHLLADRYPGLRCTLHVPTVLGRYLKQTFDYIQIGRTYGQGRKFPISKGIIGKSYSQKGPHVENFRSDEEYRQRMVNEYGYTPEEMEKRTTDRKSYLCYPILSDHGDKVLGLLYFDSNVSNTFTINADDLLIKTLHSGMNAIKANFK